MPFKIFFILVLAVLFTTLVWGTEPHDKKLLYDFSPVQKFIGNHLREIAFHLPG